jgi:hypothetical protein
MFAYSSSLKLETTMPSYNLGDHKNPLQLILSNATYERFNTNQRHKKRITLYHSFGDKRFVCLG